MPHLTVVSKFVPRLGAAWARRLAEIIDWSFAETLDHVPREDRPQARRKLVAENLALALVQSEFRPEFVELCGVDPATKE